MMVLFMAIPISCSHYVLYERRGKFIACICVLAKFSLDGLGFVAEMADMKRLFKGLKIGQNR